MATRKAKPTPKPARKAAAARKPAPKAASKKAAPKKPAPKAATTAAAKLPPKWSAAQRSEFDAIQARAKALSAGLKRTDFDADGNPLPGPWASMLADLHAWARKHKVTLEQHEHDHAPPAGGSDGAPAGVTPYGYGGDCPGSFTKVEKKKVYNVTYTNTYNCTLRRQTLLGRCVYDCTLSYTI
jgi:hypothetical protein